MDLLLADLPINLGEKAQKQLKLLAKWPTDLIHRIAIEHDDKAGVLGIDMLKELDSVVNTLKREHPEVFKSLGESVREKALEVYFGGKLRAKGQRSQDALRDLRKVLKAAPKNDDQVTQLFDGGITYPAFKTAIDQLDSNDEDENEALLDYITWLGSFTGKLTSAQKQLIKRAMKMSKSALEQEEDAEAGAA
jgi:predicted site-specific integrase-resolvase